MILGLKAKSLPITPSAYSLISIALKSLKRSIKLYEIGVSGSGVRV